ncbi:hypothetical protein AAC387_Pa07g0014 [Persea americana]
MPDRNAVSWSALMAGYVHSGLSTEALSLFSPMIRAATHAPSPLPNEYVLPTTISSCSHIQALEQGKQCHTYALKTGLDSLSIAR